MAHSLEVRVPYLDNNVVDLVLTLPGRLKQNLRRDKILLREVASGLLPKAGSLRRKRGFEVPIGAWLRGPLRPALTDLLSPSHLEGYGRPKSPVSSLSISQGVRTTGVPCGR